MKRSMTASISRCLRWLIAWMLLIGLMIGSAYAEDSALTPDDIVSADGGIILHKQAERIGPDEWEVTVWADVQHQVVESPKLEVVFVLDTSLSMLGCPYMDFHNEGFFHTHNDATCPYGTECPIVGYTYHSSNKACVINWGSANEEEISPNRYDIAVKAIASLTGALPNTANIKRVVFSSNNDYYTKVVSSFDSDYKEFGGNTYLMAGVDLGCAQFSKNDTTKIMVIVTDGRANDGYTSSAFNALKESGVMVFTVGFNHHDSDLAGMAANGGAYYQASNPGELTSALSQIGAKITAMLVDPMGPNLNFDVSETRPTNGNLTTKGDTIYWTPDNNQVLTGRVVEYTYKVKLNSQADRSAGIHSNVPLNNPTSFRYSVEENGTTTEKSFQFPIPHAEYAYSSIQVKWQHNETAIQTPSAVESVISDYHDLIGATGQMYTPEFTQTDYQTITERIPTETPDEYYQYIGTIVTKNGIDSAMDEIDPTQPNAYVVIHQYERVRVGELAVGGTKSMAGREFQPDDHFTFTLTALNGAPMPKDVTVNPYSVTISPTSGTSALFNFGTIRYDTVGTYEYTIEEQNGSLDGVTYDTTVHQLVVTVTQADGNLQVTHTLDGIENGHLSITNTYVTGQLTISKQVEGNMGSKNRDFPFTLSLPDMAGKTVSISMDGGVTFEELTLNTQGMHSFTLRDDQSIIIVPASGTYSVTETDPGSYTTTYSIGQGEAVTGTSASGSVDEAGSHVVFVNTLQVSPPTGVRLSSASALMGICLAAFLIAITRMGRGCSCHDE